MEEEMSTPTSSNRIAFVCPRFSEGATVGGAETLLKALAVRCARAGRKVDFLTTCATNHYTWENSIPAGAKETDGMTVRYFPVNDDRDVSSFLRVQASIDRRVKVSASDEQTWIGNSVNSRAMLEFLRANIGNYDRVVMGPYLFGVVYFAAQIAPEKTMLVPCLHDEAFAYLGIMHEMFNSVRGFMFNTHPEQTLAQRLYGIADSKCSVVGLGIDSFDADPKAFAARRGITSPYVIYSGRREPLKGTPLMTGYLHVFRERTGRDIKLVCTGSGNIDAPSGMTEHIVDVGFVSEQEKREAMAGAVAFIHPSVNESLGIVLLESWLARTPALVHAKSEVLRDQCQRSGAGLWFRRYPDFEEELSLLLDNPAQRNALGDSGRAFVQREYSWAAVESRLFAALDAP